MNITREQLQSIETALDAAWQDIQDWVKTTRGLRERHPDPDHGNVPHERGIRESEAVIALMTPAFKVLAALTASPRETAK